MGQSENKLNLDFLDSFRGIAAFVVLVGHARWLLWEGYSSGYTEHPETYTFIEKLSVYFLSIFKFGHEAVMFFFLLSGFVIHLKYSKSLVLSKKSNFEFIPYFFKRFMRIYPPLVFALLLTFLLDIIGEGLGYLIYQKNTPIELINQNINFNHLQINLIGNFLLIANSTVEIWGSNSPMWSLKLEWWFYLIYPFFIFFNSKSILKGFLFTLGLGLISIVVKDFSFLSSVLSSFLFWFLGTFLADIYTRRLSIDFKFLSFFLFLIPLAIVFSNTIVNDFVKDLIWVMGFLGLLNVCFFFQQKGVSFTYFNKLKWLGNCSYTIYIIHFPILVFMNGIILNFYGKMPQNQIFIYLSVLIILGISYLVHLLVEKPFIRKR
jgi:peptidoglycan/LPS O-acetylase OafA/YrhL